MSDFVNIVKQVWIFKSYQLSKLRDFLLASSYLLAHLSILKGRPRLDNFVRLFLCDEGQNRELFPVNNCGYFKGQSALVRKLQTGLFGAFFYLLQKVSEHFQKFFQSFQFQVKLCVKVMNPVFIYSLFKGKSILYCVKKEQIVFRRKKQSYFRAIAASG